LAALPSDQVDAIQIISHFVRMVKVQSLTMILAAELADLDLPKTADLATMNEFALAFENHLFVLMEKPLRELKEDVAPVASDPKLLALLMMSSFAIAELLNVLLVSDPPTYLEIVALLADFLALNVIPNVVSTKGASTFLTMTPSVPISTDFLSPSNDELM